jgi:hypothetical protein
MTDSWKLLVGEVETRGHECADTIHQMRAARHVVAPVYCVLGLWLML